MKKNKLTTTARIVLALALLLFGINGFLQFMPQPQMPEAAANFLGALFVTGYIFPVINILFLIAGLLMIFNRYVPLALALITPITINIVLFHFFLNFIGGTFGYVMALLNIYLIYSYADSFKPLLKK